MSRRRRPPKPPQRLRPALAAGFILLAVMLFLVVRSGLLQPAAGGATVTPAATLVVATTAPAAGETTATSSPAAPTPHATTPDPTPTANAPPVATRASNLPTIAYADLPPEAHTTIRLIEQGGPFPFARDGITFQNRERLLPLRPQGYYREYTVITPGIATRGARRIVAGQGGELYYTDDHYDSFQEIVR